MTVATLDEVVRLIESFFVHNYLPYLIIEEENSGDEVDSKLINTLELYSFGNFNHYLAYKDQFINISKRGIFKLVVLSMISFVNDFDGYKSKIPIDSILTDEKYAIGKGLALIAFEFDELIISMINDKLIDVKIDDDGLLLVKSIKLRDSYSKSLYKLRVLDEFNDIPNRSLNHALNNLQDWYNDKLIPTRQSLQPKGLKPEIMVQQDSLSTPIKIDLDSRENSRKRKTPDQGA
ncbi:hypothetical protein DFJ63DRAFT_334708 [Scheffersomyces coipomensis]|uniref:uncharacterized protein n=1 Tax=Scheffersomyces coipomensis TaxID=1788519 RepID=UPI00315DF64E